MAYTATDYARLRSDVGASITALSDSDADAILTESASLYTGVVSARAGARVIAISRLLASSAKLTSYKQNESSENLSDVFKNLLALLKYWQDVLDKALVDETAASGSAAAMSIRVPVISSW